MSVESRLDSLERRLGVDHGGGLPPVNIFVSDNGRDPDLYSHGVCYDPRTVPEEPEAEARISKSSAATAKAS